MTLLTKLKLLNIGLEGFMKQLSSREESFVEERLEELLLVLSDTLDVLLND